MKNRYKIDINERCFHCLLLSILREILAFSDPSICTLLGTEINAVCFSLSFFLNKFTIYLSIRFFESVVSTVDFHTNFSEYYVNSEISIENYVTCQVS